MKSFCELNKLGVHWLGYKPIKAIDELLSFKYVPDGNIMARELNRKSKESTIMSRTVNGRPSLMPVKQRLSISGANNPDSHSSSKNDLGDQMSQMSIREEDDNSAKMSMLSNEVALDQDKEDASDDRSGKSGKSFF